MIFSCLLPPRGQDGRTKAIEGMIACLPLDLYQFVAGHSRSHDANVCAFCGGYLCTQGFLSGYPNLPHNELHQEWQKRFSFGFQFFLKVRRRRLRGEEKSQVLSLTESERQTSLLTVGSICRGHARYISTRTDADVTYYGDLSVLLRGM